MTVKFTQLQIIELKIPFRFAFEHSLARRREAHNLVLELSTGTGHTGYGEVLAREYLTGETIQSAWQDIREHWWPRVRELRINETDNVREALQALRPVYLEADAQRRTASYAGLDVAVVDAYARACNIAGNRMFGQEPRAENLSAPIGATSLGKTVWLARIFKWLGFRQFKLKVGAQDDADRARAVRRVIGPGADLRIDANAAWSVDQAVAMVDRIKPASISSVEQPVAAGENDAASLLAVQQRTGIPVMADESLCTMAEAGNLLGRAPDERVLLWNVRLAKVGGFSGAVAMIQLAAENGVSAHLGVLVGETSVLAAAQRALWGIGEFIHVEHGFNGLLLRGDPFAGGPRGIRGKGRPLGMAPGLGVRPRADLLRRFTIHRETLT